MDLSYFRQINNTYKSSSRQETDLYLLNRHVDDCFADTIDYHVVKRNGEPFELLIIKDTDGNTYKKKIKAKHSTPFNLGDYIEWNGQMWIVMLIDTNDKTYHSGYMYFCPLLLRWQNNSGKIIERWVYTEDFTKYSTGVFSNSNISVGDYQYGIHLPVDEETKHIKRGKRFAIDFDGIEPPDIYKLTNRKIFLSDAQYMQRGGIITWTFSYDVFNAETDKLVELKTGKQVWIPDYQEPESDPTENSNKSLLCFGEITCRGKDSITAGGNAKTFTFNPVDEDGESIDYQEFTWNWNYLDMFSDCIVCTVTEDNKCKIRVLHDELIIGSTITLSVHDASGVIITSKVVEIGGGI